MLYLLQTFWGFLVSLFKWPVMLWFLYRILNCMYHAFIVKELDLLDRYGKDSYAIVTGGTDGIGLQFCSSLAQRGFNIIIISRTREKLIQRQAELKEKYPTRDIQVLQFDFGDNKTPQDYEELAQQFLRFDVSLLINNVGLTTRGRFETNDLKSIQQYIDVNLTSQAMLGQAVAKHMNARNSRSGIYAMSSLMGDMIRPGYALYCASKYYNKLYSNSYAISSRDNQKIDFVEFKPHWVSTNSNKSAPGWFVATPREAVDGFLRQVGHTKSAVGVAPQIFLAELIKFSVWIFPVSVNEYVYVNFLGKMRSWGSRSFQPYGI